jgi:ketosteroid isomerase-like protein
LLFAAALLFTQTGHVSAAQIATWETSARAADDAYWAAYNRADADALNAWLADDVEFYHDLGGTVFGKKALSAVNDGMKTAQVTLRREAVAGTIDFHPMRKGDTVYGVLVTGEHQFYRRVKGQPEQLVARAWFSNLMLLKKKRWRVARIYSYAHVDAAPVPASSASAVEMLFAGVVERQSITSSGAPDCARPCPVSPTPDTNGATRVCVSNAGSCQVAEIRVLHDYLGTAGHATESFSTRTGEFGRLNFPDSTTPILVHAVDGGASWTTLTTHDGVDVIDAADQRLLRPFTKLHPGALTPDATGAIPVAQLVQRLQQ